MNTQNQKQSWKKKRNILSKLTWKAPSHEQTAGTTRLIQESFLKTGQDLTILWSKSDTILLADALLKIEDESIKTYGLDPLYFVRSHG